MSTDPHERTQKFFNNHNDDVISFYQSKNNKELFYSGEMGAKPIVYAWDNNGNKVSEYRGGKKGISAVSAN